MPLVQGWQLEKTRLEKTRVLLMGFIGFFQDNLEKTRENWVFFKILHFAMQNYCFLSQKVRIFYAKLYIFLTNCHQKLQNTHPGLYMQSIIDFFSYNSLIFIYDVLIVSFSILLPLKECKNRQNVSSA